MSFKKITESNSLYNNIEAMSVSTILSAINNEDKKVAIAVESVLPQIESLINAAIEKVVSGGRLFYIGAGTSGRLGVLDASECPPTFGVSSDTIKGIIAGGDIALRTAVEFAEDNEHKGWEDLQSENINSKDFVIGISAGGTAAYIINALKSCVQNNISTGSISCNPNSPVSKIADFPVEIIVGPEFITGSTRMKAGTAQKLVLNMISTAVMIKLGRVEDNKMVNMQLSNEKLINRGVKMVMDSLNIVEPETAKALLLKHGSVKKAIQSIKS